MDAKLRFDAERDGYPALAVKNYAEVLAGAWANGLRTPGTDPKTGKPYRQDDYAEDLFVHRGKDEKVDTYITCTNRNLPNLKFTVCDQYIDLAPEMHTEIQIQYSRYWLPH